MDNRGKYSFIIFKNHSQCEKSSYLTNESAEMVRHVTTHPLHHYLLRCSLSSTLWMIEERWWWWWGRAALCNEDSGRHGPTRGTAVRWRTRGRWRPQWTRVRCRVPARPKEPTDAQENKKPQYLLWANGVPSRGRVVVFINSLSSSNLDHCWRLLIFVEPQSII